MYCLPYYQYQPSYCNESCNPCRPCDPNPCNPCGRCGPPGPPGPPGPTAPNSVAYLGAISGTPSSGGPYTPTTTTVPVTVASTQQQIASPYFTTSYVTPNTDYVVNPTAGTITILNGGCYHISLVANVQSSSGVNPSSFYVTTNNTPTGSVTNVVMSSFPTSSITGTGSAFTADGIVCLPTNTVLYTFVGYSTPTTLTPSFNVSGNWLSIFVRKIA